MTLASRPVRGLTEKRARAAAAGVGASEEVDGSPEAEADGELVEPGSVAVGANAELAQDDVVLLAGEGQHRVGHVFADQGEEAEEAVQVLLDVQPAGEDQQRPLFG